MRKLIALLGAAGNGIGRLEEAAGMALIVAMAVVVNLQVFARYLFHAPFIWPEEVVRLILVWLTFLASAALTRRGADIAVDTFVDMMPARARRAFLVARDMVLTVLFAWLALQGWWLAGSVADMPLVATEWPTSLLAWPVAIGGGLIAFHAATRLLGTLFADREGMAR
ncbi:TRAP transporter small permease [Prosthecomicrobium sp. N25]|uniref:TRAP transporter small permease n=1 Tax=Prosthecomicrobium sp. N25 TaxID=3129254 RepID=UPI00307858B7